MTIDYIIFVTEYRISDLRSLSEARERRTAARSENIRKLNQWLAESGKCNIINIFPSGNLSANTDDEPFCESLMVFFESKDSPQVAGEPNAQVAEPFRSILNGIVKEGVK